MLLYRHLGLLFFFLFQVMIDFQAAERKSLEEPPSEIGLEVLCAMVCTLCQQIISDRYNKQLF